MPELPEVETVRRQLAEEILGEEIVSVEIRRKSCYEGVGEPIGEVIKQVRRVGKYLFIYFSSGRGLAIHLKMTGRLVVDDQWYEKAPHTRVVMRLRSGRSLYYWDMRTFGYVKYQIDIARVEKAIASKLGPDPWEMSKKELKKKLGKTGRAIKEAILDQTLIAGVGNIYANDGLHLAGILPQREARGLDGDEVGRLLESLRVVMERGLETNGASDNSYVDARGMKGEYQNEFRVYGKRGEKCMECGRELEYGKVGGRGTWWCKNCQR